MIIHNWYNVCIWLYIYDCIYIYLIRFDIDLKILWNLKFTIAFLYSNKNSKRLQENIFFFRLLKNYRYKWLNSKVFNFNLHINDPFLLKYIKLKYEIKVKINTIFDLFIYFQE